MKPSKLIVTAAGACSALAVLSAPFSAMAQEKGPVTIEALAKLKRVSSPAISPDGDWIAYVVEGRVEGADKTRAQLFMASADGKTVLPMTSASYDAHSPQWSPDGKQLAFLAARSDLDENAATQVWTLDMRGGEARAYTDVTQGISGFEWAPDGKRMLLMIQDEGENARKKREAREAGEDEPELPWVIDRRQFKEDGVGYLDRSRTHIYVIAERLAEPVQITDGDRDDHGATWSPDGTRIAYATNVTEDPDGNYNTDIFVIDAAAGSTPVQVTTNPGGETSPAWSPDGKTLAYTTSLKPELLWYATSHLATSPATGGSVRLLTESLDRNVFDPAWSPDGKSIYFTIENEGMQPIMAADVRTGRLSQYVSGQFAIYDYDVAGNGDLALRLTNPTLPSEIFLKSGRQLTQVTRTNEAVLDTLDLAKPQFVSFDNPDGISVDEFIYPAKDVTGPAPAILFNHGGPVAQYDYSFEPFAQLFAANGYATVMVNPRGSSGKGEDFKKAIFAEWGVKDFADVMAGVDTAVDLGLVDPDRLGVGGWSYGGILTNYVITQTDRFKAAVSGASEVNYTANYGHDIYQREWEIELGLPWENQEGWDAISPFWDAPKVTTPTQFMVGQEDWNVPAMNSEQFYLALKRLGIDTKLVVYPGEDHSIDRPSFVDDRYQRFIDWYDTYLKP
ncbi:S9 family peptidase [Henriciella mobilis]|nr:S9 family peptidase [Henriciella mobilis]